MTAKGGGAKSFSGFIFAKVDGLRHTYEKAVTTNIHFTPLEDGDQAHADMTFTGWNIETKPELDRFTIWLSDHLYALQYDPGAPEGARGQLDFFPPAADLRTLSEKAADTITAIREKFKR